MALVLLRRFAWAGRRALRNWQSSGLPLQGRPCARLLRQCRRVRSSAGGCRAGLLLRGRPCTGLLLRRRCAGLLRRCRHIRSTAGRRYAWLLLQIGPRSRLLWRRGRCAGLLLGRRPLSGWRQRLSAWHRSQLRSLLRQSGSLLASRQLAGPLLIGLIGPQRIALLLERGTLLIDLATDSPRRERLAHEGAVALCFLSRNLQGRHGETPTRSGPHRKAGGAARQDAELRAV